MSTSKNFRAILLLLSVTFLVILFVFFSYTFLHELGHAIAGVSFGQALTEFDVSFWDMSAHVGLAGGALNEIQLAIRSAAGTLLPLATWAVFISLVPRRGSFILEELKLLSSMVVVNTLLVWIVIPVLFVFGKAPSDDVTNFLLYSRMPPLLLSLLALVVYAAGWRLFLSKIEGLQSEFLLFRTTDSAEIKAGIRTTLPVMTGIMLFCAVLTVTFNQSAAAYSPDRFSPPQDFVPVAQVDLSVRPYPSETVAQLTLDRSSYARVFIEVRNINTTYFDLSISGPDGLHDVLLHGEGYRADRDGGLWEKSLPPGTYQLVLTSHQSPGTVFVYSSTR